jgi:hypothetical protein
LSFSEWGQIITDPRLVAAVIDRVTFNAHILETGTDSYRHEPGRRSLNTRSRRTLRRMTDDRLLAAFVGRFEKPFCEELFRWKAASLTEMPTSAATSVRVTGLPAVRTARYAAHRAGSSSTHSRTIVSLRSRRTP